MKGVHFLIVFQFLNTALGWPFLTRYSGFTQVGQPVYQVWSVCRVLLPAQALLARTIPAAVPEFTSLLLRLLLFSLKQQPAQPDSPQPPISIVSKRKSKQSPHEAGLEISSDT